MTREKMPSFAGIDVSKDAFNARWENRGAKYGNSPKGWRRLLREAPKEASFAMEATGNYHYMVASFLHGKGRRGQGP